jgi:adenosine kinase
VRIVVTGSLAYDYIMSFPGYFKDHLLMDRVHTLSVSFLVDSMKRMRGGVAGNIAYTLTLLGERPLIVGTVGHDFADYRQWMDEHGIDTSGIIVIPTEFTASCFINTDLANNQLVALYAGAMAHARDISIRHLGLGKGDLVVISPSDPEGMSRIAAECRELGVPFLYDPGKQMPRLQPSQILDYLQDAFILIANDYELAMMAQKTGKSEKELIALPPLCVITRGAEGSTFYSAHGRERVEIPVAEAENRDPTGAGDAYLAGMVFGIARRFAIPVIGRVASLAAAYAIEQRGCQEHCFTPAEFSKRYIDSFGPSPEIEAYARLKGEPTAPP